MSDARPTPPWAFSITIVPFAAAVGYVTIAAPYWLAIRGASVAAIGAMSATALSPHALKLLWAPLLDIGAHRRTWFVATTIVTGIMLAALAILPAPERQLGLFTGLALVANIAATTAAAASDGLMAITTRPDQKGSAAAWRMAGNVGGTGVLGAGIMWIAKVTSVATAGTALAVCVLASALSALLIHEPRSLHRGREAGESAAREAMRRFLAIVEDLWATVKSRDGWTGIVICAVPVGAGALTNLFSALAPAYGASEDRVALVNGLWGGVVGAAGSFVGGWIADRMNRRLAYALSGLLIAGSAGAMLVAPMTPATYTWGTLAYNFATGVSFAALAAFVLEIVGHSVAVTTKYTLFIAVANLAGSYVTAIDGAASEIRGVGARGTLAADAALTLAGIGVLLAMVWWTRGAGRAASPSATS